MFSVKTQHSDPYTTTTGLTRALYNLILVFLDISLLQQQIQSIKIQKQNVTHKIKQAKPWFLQAFECIKTSYTPLTT
jgi:hypothetical protein